MARPGVVSQRTKLFHQFSHNHCDCMMFLYFCYDLTPWQTGCLESGLSAPSLLTYTLTIICTTYLVLFNITFIFTPCIISVSGHTNQILCWLDQMTFQEGSVGTLKTNNSHMINILATVLQKCSLAAFQRIIPSIVWQTWALLDFQALFYGVHLYISTQKMMLWWQTQPADLHTAVDKGCKNLLPVCACPCGQERSARTLHDHSRYFR